MAELKSREIFDFVRQETKNVHHALMQTDDIPLEDEVRKNIEQFSVFQNSLDRKLVELEGDTHWDKFTIAFYGETNAGKSTIIEALRLAMNEAGSRIMKQGFRI